MATHSEQDTPMGGDADPLSRRADGRGRRREDANILTFGRFVSVIWRRIWVILVTLILFVGVTFGFSLAQTPVYEASIVLVVRQQSSEPGDLANDVQGLHLLTETVAEGVDSPPVATAVIRELGLQTTPEAFLEDLSAAQVTETQFVGVTYRDPNPEKAQQVVDTVGDVFSQRAFEKISPSGNGVTVEVWERAQLPEEPVSPNLMINLTFAVVTSLVSGVALAFLLNSVYRSRDSLKKMD